MRRRRRRTGGTFFIIALLVLIFALVYTFAGGWISPFWNRAPVPGNNEIFVTFLDVGQGDSILLRSATNAVLIDGGEHRERQVVINYLRRAGIRRLDYVVATHPHSDHIGGLIAVLGQFDVGRVLMPDATHNTTPFENFLEAIENNEIPVTHPAPGDRFRAGIIDLMAVAPIPGHHENLNNASIVLRMNHGATSFLFTGDAERLSEEYMLAGGLTLRSNVLKVGHHGSRTSTSAEFLDAINPTIAVISAGADNQFGHPHPEVLELLESRGVQVYRTDLHGTIRMVTNGQTIYRN